MLKFVRVSKVKTRSWPDDDFSTTIEEVEPTVINPAAIKSYYQRKNERVGTRINFQIGNGFAIKETVAEFEALLGLAGTEVIGVPAAVAAQTSELTN